MCGFCVRGQGYNHPPLTYGIALALFPLFLWLGVRRPSVGGTPRADAFATAQRLPPGLWMLRISAFGAAFIVLANLFVLRNIVPIPLLSFAMVAGVDLASVLLIRQWSRRRG